MCNERQQAITQGVHVMIQDMEEQALQIRDISRLMESQDLAISFCHHFGP